MNTLSLNYGSDDDESSSSSPVSPRINPPQTQTETAPVSPKTILKPLSIGNFSLHHSRITDELNAIDRDNAVVSIGAPLSTSEFLKRYNSQRDSQDSKPTCIADRAKGQNVSSISSAPISVEPSNDSPDASDEISAPAVGDKNEDEDDESSLPSVVAQIPMDRRLRKELAQARMATVSQSSLTRLSREELIDVELDRQFNPHKPAAAVSAAMWDSEQGGEVSADGRTNKRKNQITALASRAEEMQRKLAMKRAQASRKRY